MSKHLLIIGIAVLLLAVGLSGCNTRLHTERNIDDRFVGIWEGEDELGYAVSINFSSDGGFSTIYGERGKYEIKDEGLFMTVMTGDLKAVQIYEYVFSDNNNTLLLNELGINRSIVYTRQ
ncbi:MAG: hypothetical protein JSW60_04300 [Thermoplasmatales archaeon]|nr:MAG: hypothetical protein JSW60_04300 [Thermoplasmatales archaeon]